MPGRFRPARFEAKGTKMGRSLFLIAVAWFGFLLLHQHGWDWFGLDEKFAWALLLPSVYIAGMAILRD